MANNITPEAPRSLPSGGGVQMPSLNVPWARILQGLTSGGASELMPQPTPHSAATTDETPRSLPSGGGLHMPHVNPMVALAGLNPLGLAGNVALATGAVNKKNAARAGKAITSGGISELIGTNPSAPKSSAKGPSKQEQQQNSIAATLAGIGYGPEQVATIMGRYNQAQARAQALKGLPKEMAAILDTVDQETLAAQQSAQPQQSSLFNTLAMQMFFTKTIAPYLQGLGNQLKEEGAAARKSINVNSLPPAYRNIMNQALATQQQGTNNLAAALSSSAVAGPYVDQLNKQLEAAIQAQNYDRYVRERQLAYQDQTTGLLSGLTGTGATGQATAPTSNDLSEIQKILSGGYG